MAMCCAPPKSPNNRNNGQLLMQRTIWNRLGNAASAARSSARTLRVRLMVWNAALVLATAMACFLGIREGVRLTLVNEMDHVLAADLREIALEADDLHATVADVKSPPPAQKG